MVELELILCLCGVGLMLRESSLLAILISLLGQDGRVGRESRALICASFLIVGFLELVKGVC